MIQSFFWAKFIKTGISVNELKTETSAYQYKRKLNNAKPKTAQKNAKYTKVSK